MTRVVHFDIPIDDPARAEAFYREALGWKVERWGPVEYWVLSTGQEQGPGAEGALTPRSDAPEGVIVYFDVEDIGATMTMIEDAGGLVVTDRIPIPTVGWSAHVRDTEGNLIGLFQDDPGAALPDTGRQEST